VETNEAVLYIAIQKSSYNSQDKVSGAPISRSEQMYGHGLQTCIPVLTLSFRAVWKYGTISKLHPDKPNDVRKSHKTA
jgi:hypothetical protein